MKEWYVHTTGRGPADHEDVLDLEARCFYNSVELVARSFKSVQTEQHRLQRLRLVVSMNAHKSLIADGTPSP